MSEQDLGSHGAGSRFSGVGEALRRNRWILAAAIVAILVVNTVGGPLIVAVAAIALVTVVAAVASFPKTYPRETLVGGGGGELSADDIAAAISDPLIVIDGDGTIARANRAAHSAFGPLSLGSDLSLRFRSPGMQDFLRRVRADAGGGWTDYLERVPLERFYRVSGRPVPETGLTVLIFRDQSELRRIDRMRADFVANASHELRTPLASIAGFIETLRGPARNDAAARESFLQIMQGQTERMTRLIDDLLSLSRLEMKGSVDPAVRVDLAELVSSVLDSLAPLAAELGVSIARTLPETPTQVTGNRDELIQVFENLVENACKYGGSGGRIEVTVAEEAGKEREIRATVRDFGPGIADEHIPRLTERFYRVEDGSVGTAKGTGLGLAIVKHILTRHNGYLTIASERGNGAAFTVHLPAA